MAKMKPQRVEIGMRGRDVVTGFEGVVIGATYWLTGCRQVGLAPKVGADGKYPDSQWFDENRIRIVDEKRVMEPRFQEPPAVRDTAGDPGGPGDAAPPREPGGR